MPEEGKFVLADEKVNEARGRLLNRIKGYRRNRNGIEAVYKALAALEAEVMFSTKLLEAYKCRCGSIHNFNYD